MNVLYDFFFYFTLLRPEQEDQNRSPILVISVLCENQKATAQ